MSQVELELNSVSVYLCMCGLAEIMLISGARVDKIGLVDHLPFIFAFTSLPRPSILCIGSLHLSCGEAALVAAETLGTS